MIENQVLKLLKESKLGNDLTVPVNQELVVIRDVVYMNGYILDPALQGLFINWIKNNPTLFQDVTLNWKRR